MHQLLYTICRDKSEAQRIATALLEARLIACANCLPEVTSWFHWEEKVHHATECVLLMKSTAAAYAQIEQMILHHHSYEIPAILQLDVSGGLPAFLDWIAEETVVKE